MQREGTVSAEDGGAGLLPFGLQVQSVRVREDGLAVRATAEDTVLRAVAPAGS